MSARSEPSSPPSLEVRRLRPDDMPAFLRCFGRAIGFPIIDADVDRFLRLLELDGSFIAVQGGEVVGTLGAYRFELSTPGGGELSAAGTTLVGVLPTHRRQGVLRGLMIAHLDWARELALEGVGLWSSEPGIYPRFGFGLATHRGGLQIDARAARFEARVPPHELRYVEPEEALPRLAATYAERRRDRAGALSRAPNWWTHRRIFDDPARRGGFSPFEWVEARRDEETVGYLQYRRRSQWDEGRPADILEVVELIGDGPARRALWRFALTMDLVGEVRVFNAPVDDELPWLLGHRRHARPYPEDALWLCPLAPEALLTSRRFVSDDALTLDIRGAGRFDLEVREGAAACTPTTRAPDVSLDIVDLPGLAWGDVSAAALGDAGRLEGDANALRRFDRLLSTGRRPWCPERF